MVRPSKPKLVWLVLAAVALVAPIAGAATLKDRARLREGPSKETALLGWVEEGATVAIESERGGWYAIRTADGKIGYVWQDHLRFDAGEPGARLAVATTTVVVPATAAPATSVPAASPPTTIVGEARPPSMGDAGASADLERLRVEVARLAAAQEELMERLPRRGAGAVIPSVPIGTDGSAGAAATFFLAGALVGAIIGYVARARRDRRSRIRL